MARRRKGPKQQTLESTLGMYFAILPFLSLPLLQLSHICILFAVDGAGVAIDLGMGCCFHALSCLQHMSLFNLSLPTAIPHILDIAHAYTWSR